MWTKSGIESEGQYAFSCELLRTLRFIYEVQSSEKHPWRKTIDSILKSFLSDFSSINRPKEAEILFGLLRGCDYNGLAPFMSAVTANREKIQIIGFVQSGWLSRTPDGTEKTKIFEDFSQKDLKALAVLYNDKHKEKCEFQLYDPSEIRLVNDTAPTIQNNSLFKNQFNITSEILDRLFEDSDLLSSIDEEEDLGQKSLDIFQLNTRTMIMKMINYQLQNNSHSFLQQLKSSNFYQGLLKFVCKESSIEMKGDIMLLEWLEQRCFAIRKYACENQQSLVKQREVHVTLVKDKIYISYQHPTLKKEKQMYGIPLKSALNFKNLEEKKEVKLINSHDVFITQGEQQGKAEQQIVLIDPETLNSSNGLDIINAGVGAITYGVDLNKIVKQVFIKQRENRDKYLELATKTIFLVTEEDYRKIFSITQSTQFKRTTTTLQKVNSSLSGPNAPGQGKPQQQDEDDDNFDSIFASELVNYGGFSQGLAKKTFGKETIESKTETLVQLIKQNKDGIFDLDDNVEGALKQENAEKVLDEAAELNQAQAKIEKLKQNAEERSDTLAYLKVSFQQAMDQEHSDQCEKSTKDALQDTINSFSKKDLASDYEKSMIRLFNMYCRHVFWSLIQKDDIEKIFSMVLESENDMKQFSVFLKVLGNECFITGNKVYIKSFKAFLKKVVSICCRISKFTPLLTILIKDGIINSYQSYIDELKNDTKGFSTVRIEEFFKTETKASQLINPFIIVPLLTQIVHENFEVISANFQILVSNLIAINNLFIGNYKLKKKVWMLIILILEQVRQRANHLPYEQVRKLLKLKIVDNLFGNFEEQASYEKEEVEYVKRVLKDNTASEIEGVSRRDVEKLVYAKRAQIVKSYQNYKDKQTQSILIEMLYKFYLIDKALDEPSFNYRNNLTSHLNVYSSILEQGRDSKLNDYMLFFNQLEDPQRIITTFLDTNHKEFEGRFRAKITFQGAEKLLFRVDDKSQLKLGDALLVSSDKEGRNVESLIFDSHLRKEQAMKNIYSNSAYLHYPVKPSAIYTFSINDEKPVPSLIDCPIYQPLERYEEQTYGKFYLTKGNKMYLWKNDQLTRFKDHWDVSQFTFGKQSRIILLKNGKVMAEGRSKCKHFQDTDEEVNDLKPTEIPFYEKKDKIIQISTFFQVTIATTEKGKVFAVGDKLAKLANIENTKFGFYEVPLFSESTEYKVDEPLEEPMVHIISPIEEEKKDSNSVQQKTENQESNEKNAPAPSEAQISEEQAKKQQQIEEKKNKAEEVKKQQEPDPSAEDDKFDLGGMFDENPAPAVIQKDSQPNQEQSKEVQEENRLKKLNKQANQKGIHQQDEIFKYWLMNGQLYCEDLASLLALQEDNQLQLQIDVIQQQVISNPQLQNQVIQIVNQVQPDKQEDQQQLQQQLSDDENKAEQNNAQAANIINDDANDNQNQPLVDNAADQVLDLQQIVLVEEQQPANVVDEEQKHPGEENKQEDQQNIQPVEEQKQQKDEEEEKKEESKEPAVVASDEQGEQIDTSIKEDGVDKSPELKALRAWAAKTVNTNEFVYLTVVQNIKTNHLEIRTIGTSNLGQLGQGPDVKNSSVFRRVMTNIEPRSLNDVIVGYDHVIVVSKHERVYGWGCYTAEDPQHFKPVHIPFFDDYIVHKMQSSQRTCAIISPRSNPSKKLIILGKFFPLVKTDSYKVYDMFQDKNIYNAQPYSDKIYVSIQGDYKVKKPVPNPYVHEQSCSLCQGKIEGILHFSKTVIKRDELQINDIETQELIEEKKNDTSNSTTQYHYYCLGCVNSGEVNAKDNPEYLWVAKRPIKNIETKNIPEIKIEELFDEEQRGVEQINYLTHIKINGKDIQYRITQEQLLKDHASDLNPIIAIRTTRALKEDAKLQEPIILENFYDLQENYGLTIGVTPDYGYHWENNELITKNQASWDKIDGAVKEIEGLDIDLQKEFKTTIEEYVSKKLKDQSLNDIKYQDLKVQDELKFRSDRLNELTEDVKKLNVGRFIQYCQYIWGAFSYISKSSQADSSLSLLKVFNQNRHKIPLMLKNRLLKTFLESMSTDDSQVSVHVNRKRAKEFFDSGKVDEKGDHTVFSQVMRGLFVDQYRGMRINQSDKKAWFVKFLGEFALDSGGLFRESLTELCQELQSHVLNLLVPTQNQKNNHGENREKWTINPAASSPSQMQMFDFLGALIGMSVRSGILMSLNLPSFVWKQLTNEEVTLKDLAGIDTMTVQILENLKDIQNQMDEETFLEGYDLFFTTILSNGEEVELLNGGKGIRVNFSNLKEYISRTIEVRINECKKQIKALKKGIDKTFDSSVLKLLCWSDLEYKVVGKEVVDIERLKDITVYRNCAESTDTVKKFWKILNGFTNEERMLYLKFVWGRTRLPLKEEEVTENHTIQMDESADVAKLPVGRTCFFRLEIPPYKNEDTFRDKLYYAIKFCTAIDADIENAVQQEEEHLHEHQERLEDNDEASHNEEEDQVDHGNLFGDDY